MLRPEIDVAGGEQAGGEIGRVLGASEKACAAMLDDVRKPADAEADDGAPHGLGLHGSERHVVITARDNRDISGGIERGEALVCRSFAGPGDRDPRRRCGIGLRRSHDDKMGFGMGLLKGG